MRRNQKDFFLLNRRAEARSLAGRRQASDSAALNKTPDCQQAASAAEPPEKRVLCTPLFDGFPPYPQHPLWDPVKKRPSGRTRVSDPDPQKFQASKEAEKEISDQ